MNIAVYPGSFDPITNGHVDVIERASKIFDEVVVLINQNPNKHNHFTVEERIEMIKKCVAHLPNVRVDSATGLTIHYAEKINAKALVRGIRAVSDYEYEMIQATANMFLNSKIETMFFLARPNYSFLSSSAVVEMAANGGNIHTLVPDCVEEDIIRRIGRGE